MKSFDEFKDQLDEKYQVVAKTKDGETFKSGVYDTKKKAHDMHWKLAKGNKHKSVETVKVDEEVDLEEATVDVADIKKKEMISQKDKDTLGKLHSLMAKEKAKKSATASQAMAKEETQPQGDTMSNMDQYINAIGENADFRGGLEEQQKKAHTVPKSEKEKDLAKLAPPHDKITHADVMVGRGVKKEEVESIDEISDKTKKTYVNAAALDAARLGNTLGRLQGIASTGSQKVIGDKITNRLTGIKRATSKMAEDVDQIDEAKDMMKVASAIEAYAKSNGGIDKADMLKVAGMIKRGDMKGAEKYTMRLDSDPRDFLLSKMGFNEAKEPPFDMPYKKAEPVTKTDKSGAVHTPMSRARDLARQAMKKQMKENFDLDITDEQADSLVESANLEEKTLTPAEMKKREEIAKAMERKDPGMDMSKKMAIATATAKKVAEETEELDEISKATLKSYVKKATSSDDERSMSNLASRAGYKHGSDVSGDSEDSGNDDDHKSFLRSKGVSKAVDRLTKEEVDLDEDQLDEISKDTLGSYIKKAKGSAIGAAQVTGMGASMTGQKTQDKAERKVQKRASGINKAVDRLTKEEMDLEEEYKEVKVHSNGGKHIGTITHGKYQSVAFAHPNSKFGGSKEPRDDEDSMILKGPQDNQKGIDFIKAHHKSMTEAVDRLTKEETDLEEGMISYTDFMDKIKMHRKAGNKIVDDKYSDKHATYTSVDSEGTAKKITHTPAGVKQQHMGNMKADDDQAAEAKPAEKRSRGRPAGSKSGVSKYNN